MKFRLFCSHKQRTAIGTFMLNGDNMVALQCDKCGKFEVMPMCLMQQLRHNFVFDVDVTGIDMRYIPASHEMMKIIEKVGFEKSILCERIKKLKAEPSVVGDKEFQALVKKSCMRIRERASRRIGRCIDIRTRRIHCLAM